VSGAQLDFALEEAEVMCVWVCVCVCVCILGRERERARAKESARAASFRSGSLVSMYSSLI